MKKSIVLILTLLVCTLVLFGCSTQDSEEKTSLSSTESVSEEKITEEATPSIPATKDTATTEGLISPTTKAEIPTTIPVTVPLYENVPVTNQIIVEFEDEYDPFDE